MNNIELVVFDIAGTTVADNGEIAESFKTALGTYGYVIPVEKINALMGYKKPEAISKILDEFESDKTKIDDNYIDQIHQKFESTMVEYYKSTEQLMPLPYAEKLFEYLHEKGIKVALDTGFSREITDIIIEKLGWIKDNKIDTYCCSDEVAKGRPSPLMIQKIMHDLLITDSSKVIKVGDTEVDINEGFNAQCKFSIGVTTGAFTEDALIPYNPSFIIHSLEELIPVIENNWNQE